MLYPPGSRQPGNVWVGAVVMNVPQPDVSPTPTPSITPTQTITPTPSITPTQTTTPTNTQTPTPTLTPTNTPTNTITPTNTPTNTPSITPTNTPTNTTTPTKTPTNTPTNTPTPSITPPPSGTTEANAYLSAVVNAGGTGITSTISAATRTLFTSLVSNGLWDKLICFYPILGGNAAGHKFNGKNPLDTDGAYRLQFNGGWTHNASGMTGNITDTYANTYLNPEATASLTLSGGAMGFYASDDNQSRPLACVYGAGDRAWCYTPNSSSLSSANAWEAATGISTAIVSPMSGLVGFGRTGTTQVDFYRRGALQATVNKNAANKPNQNQYIGASNNNGSFGAGTSRTFRFAFFGTTLTPTDWYNIDTIVQTYQTSLGRNYY
jgi:hypothetical protein